VKAVPRVYNWCFLIGACVGVFASLAFDMVEGILLGYGVIVHAISYSRLASHFKHSESVGGDSRAINLN